MYSRCAGWTTVVPDVESNKSMSPKFKLIGSLACLALASLNYGEVKPDIVQEPTPVVAYKTFCDVPWKQFHEVVVPLADLISKGEGDWNAVNRGYAGDTPGGIQRLTGKTFENFTVGQVMDMQKNWLYAVGRYQFIPKTLRFAVRMSDVSELDMFTPETQNKLFAALLQYKRPAVAAYIRGDHDYQGWALNELAKEWASIEYRYGRGYYDHIGGNRAHITRTEVAVILEDMREDYTK